MAYTYDADGSLTAAGGNSAPPVVFNRILIIDTPGLNSVPIPVDFTQTNRIHLIGGGRGGAHGQQATTGRSGRGGQGGSYARLNNVDWSGLSSVDIYIANIGPSGGSGSTQPSPGEDSYIDDGSNIIALAPGGGSASLGIGDAVLMGGETFPAAVTQESATGGGGAAGPNGKGGNGGQRLALSVAGCGGGAANGGSPGGDTPNGGNSIGGDGGDYGLIPGGAGGTSGNDGGDGSGGSGGGGGGSTSGGRAGNGGAGSIAPIWTDGVNFFGPGSGGGAGGVVSSSASNGGGHGGDGGKYGGGGGGGGKAANSSPGPGLGGQGGQGLCVIEWYVP